MRRSDGVAALLLVATALAPLYLPSYDLTLVGRFLALGILALGIVLVWGHAGVLPLGEGVYFGRGGYGLALHLTLKAVPPDELPGFMMWNGVDQLPWWWRPSTHGGVAVLLALVLPALAAVVLGWLVFPRRTTSVYVAPIRQALALTFATLLISQQGTTGGFNGLTNFDTLFGWPLNDARVRVGLHLVTVALAGLAFAGARVFAQTQAGRLVLAIRDGENRVRFLGYDPMAFKLLVFVLGAVLAALGGMLHTVHLGVISPAMVGVVPSIEMVIWVAVGGRASLLGALVGTVLVNLGKDWISSAWPEAWLFVMGLLCVLVVVPMPSGLAGLAARLRWPRRKHAAKARPTAPLPEVKAADG